MVSIRSRVVKPAASMEHILFRFWFNYSVNHYFSLRPMEEYLSQSHFKSPIANCLVENETGENSFLISTRYTLCSTLPVKPNVKMFCHGKEISEYDQNGFRYVQVPKEKDDSFNEQYPFMLKFNCTNFDMRRTIPGFRSGSNLK